jgi:cytochrome bd-type quinol oxidase subunit 2
MEPIKVLILIVLAAIVISLGSALFHLSRGKTEEDSRKMARALTVRIGLSLVLFLLLMAAWYFGLIKPH